MLCLLVGCANGIGDSWGRSKHLQRSTHAIVASVEAQGWRVLELSHMERERPGVHCQGQGLHPVPIRHWEGWQHWYWEDTEGNSRQLDWEALLSIFCLVPSLPQHLPHTAATTCLADLTAWHLPQQWSLADLSPSSLHPLPFFQLPLNNCASTALPTDLVSGAAIAGPSCL